MRCRPAPRPSSFPSAAPSRAARTWRSASTMSGPRSWPAGSPRRWATRWSRRCWPMCRKARSRRRPSTCAFPARSRSPTPAFKSTLEAAARSLRQAGFTHIVLLGDHGGYQHLLEGGRGRAEPRLGRHAACGPTSSTTITARPKPPMCRPCAPRASAPPRSASMPARPTPRCMLAIDPATGAGRSARGRAGAGRRHRGRPTAVDRGIGPAWRRPHRRRRLSPPSAKRGRRSIEARMKLSRVRLCSCPC